MKNIKKLLALLLAMTMLLSFCACDIDGVFSDMNDELSEVFNNTLPEENESDVTEESESDVSEESSFTTEYTIESTETTNEMETESDEETAGTVTYRVTVVDESGAPVPNAMIQICLDACIPTTTNADGVAEWTVEEADYKVSFLTLPAGYTYVDDVMEFYFDGETEMTIVLKAET